MKEERNSLSKSLCCVIKFLHPSHWVGEFGETELTVKPMCVAGYKAPAAESLQVGMRHDAFHHPLAEGLSTVIFVDEDIAEIGEDCMVGDDAGKADLYRAIINAEIQRVFDGAFDQVARAFVCPVGAGEKITNGVNVEAGWII